MDVFRTCGIDYMLVLSGTALKLAAVEQSAGYYSDIFNRGKVSEKLNKHLLMDV